MKYWPNSNIEAFVHFSVNVVALGRILGMFASEMGIRGKKRHKVSGMVESDAFIGTFGQSTPTFSLHWIVANARTQAGR